MTRLREVLGEAEAFVGRMPTEKAGLLFLKDGHVMHPDPEDLRISLSPLVSKSKGYVTILFIS